jgi:lysophospholipase L1-like esterase
MALCSRHAMRVILPWLMLTTLIALESQPSAKAIVVCLGDSITDGNTWPQIVRQALQEHGVVPPTLICAGVGGDRSAEMIGRYERDVTPFTPAWVAVSAGTNDALKGVAPEEYLRNMRALAGRIQRAGSRPLLLTPCTVGSGNPRLDDAAPRLEAYAAGVIALGRELDLPVADVHAGMRAAVGRGEPVFSGDGVHPAYRGQELIARAVLDAWAWRDVALPKRFDPQPYPGLIRDWEVRRSDAETWQSYQVPEPASDTAPSAEDWAEQCRRNGFACRIKERIGAGILQVRTTVSTEGGDAWLSLGGNIRRLKVDGKPVALPPGWTGYHAGHIRIPVRLAAGDYRIEADIEGMFLVLFTPECVWER